MDKYWYQLVERNWRYGVCYCGPVRSDGEGHWSSGMERQT